MLGHGSYKLRSSEDGMEKVRVIKGFCFATEIRGSARHSLGNKRYSPGGKGEANSY